MVPVAQLYYISFDFFCSRAFVPCALRAIDTVATSIDAPQHVRVDTRGSQTEGIKDVASLRLALSPINFNHGTTNHAVHHFVIHLLLITRQQLHKLLTPDDPEQTISTTCTPQVEYNIRQWHRSAKSKPTRATAGDGFHSTTSPHRGSEPHVSDASLHQTNRYDHHSDGNDIVDLTDHRTHRSSQTAEHALATTISTSHALAITNGSSNALASTFSTSNALANTFNTSNALANTCSTSNALAITNGTSNALANTFGTSHVLTKPSNHRLGTSTATHMDADIKLCLRPRAPRCVHRDQTPSSSPHAGIQSIADARSLRMAESQQHRRNLRRINLGSSLHLRVRHVPPSRNKQGLNHFAHAGSARPSASSTTRA
ncbi:hypothetical protein MTP99_015271 [Tenebrio molitor]|nr:hypothetical protein MTP99_015271 [Tenebrio molitor]